MEKLHKKIRTAAVLSVLAGGLALSSIASAFGESAPAGVEIQAVNLLDTASDVVGSADFTPEGNKDGHFKLTLKLAKQTTINAVVLRSTDAYGKDNYQGVWRTNRATTGWLLGIMQGDDVINPGFRKDVKEPVGTFEGSLNWDLYASNNGTIKETQYYVLELETAQGTVSSKPFRYQKPHNGGNTPEATPAPTQSPAPSQSPTQPTQPPASTPTPAPAQTPASTPTLAAERPLAGSIQLRIDSTNAVISGKEQLLEVAPFFHEGRTMVPLRFISEALGATVEWEAASQSITIARGVNRIQLQIGSKEAGVNKISHMLDAAPLIKEGLMMVPLRFIGESLDMKVAFDEGNITITEEH